MAEIRDLGKTTMGIDNDFYKVKMAFNKVDNAGFNFPRKLEPEWDVLRKKWQTLLWDSRETATRMEVRLETFEAKLTRVEEILSDTSLDPIDAMLDARDILQDFASKPNVMTALAREGQNNVDLFKDLASEMNTFKATFDGFTKAEQTKIEAQIASLKQRINQISAEIKQCDDMVAKLSRALGFTIFGTIVGAGISLFAFGILGPLVAIKVLIVGAIIAIGQKAALSNYQRRSQELKNELRAKEGEMKALQGKLQLLQECEALLEAQKSVIGDIASRISQIGDIWLAIQHDATRIDAKIAEASTENDRVYLNQLLQETRDIYSPLRQGLRTYATETAKALRPK
ncbi:unnamed protein product [Rhizoctonia solani]|uniref:Uncharacterized protein n=1 Tax=Rhizoctonia solani TaxID=456999 RepID=A0A8H3HDM5_9AGAM|nr:unnamed protein product [Rhizoctonia solani]